ncbi:hypothetical protein J4573_53445, partial [Actinomadura barringtoniae]
MTARTPRTGPTPNARQADQPGARLGKRPVRDDSVVGRLTRVREALAVLDATDPDTDSISFDQATDRLIAAARAVVTAAEPILASPCTTAAIVRDA